ncbi:Bug family tripartite tricarboxylate transporter substrate binding protein [Achromobacter denitrificans]|uniref:Bug family tripartite tricarboxylate transporter substrate binding protein n=1 Tax=Achromobacter denitrificans TaxID=32002 RepID=UPI0023E3EFB3|nr:tripartite tricarboxylate transporter substrate-binding protein [Achromobacter denitrificans]MDF3847902.1 tripartite tricarboxylate transporter substrate-binding protein [Achromobacter denitrificans]MDF3938548.1 tripartite tricarboxylate transporter substrate-binding protein [Achromobacter denitrificans]
MSKTMKQIATLLLLGAACMNASAAFPDKPINMVVPFGAGSATDTLARGVAKGLSERLGQPVTVENKPGAGGGIGAAYVARSAPDGYTLLMGTNGPMAANASLYQRLPYDPVKDFAPVALMGRLPMILIGNADAKATTLPELIAAARAQPGVLNFGASNTTARVWVELLKRMADVDVATVLYSNVGGMMTDLMSGRITYAFENVGPSLPQIAAGKVRALAVTTPQRAPFAPDIPTVAESGLDKHELVVWFAMFAPRGTPAPVVERINAEVNRVLGTDELRQLSAQIGMTPAAGSPKDLEAYQESEVKNWRSLVDMTGVRID